MPEVATPPKLSEQKSHSKNHAILPNWLNNHHVEINASITRVLSAFRPEIREMAEDAACRGRKLRGTLALQLIEWCNWEISPEERVELLTDIARMEILHSMSCALDDVIDGDDERRGEPAFHIRQKSKAASMLLPPFFAAEFSQYEGFSRRITQVIEGELFDSLLLARHGIDNFDDPINYYLQKSSPPFAHASMVTAKRSGRSPEEIEKADHYGEAIGKYYQVANDHHDCFTIPVDVRGSLDETVPLNFSIPFYLYCKKNPAFAARLGTEVSRRELANIIAEMKIAGIEEESASYVQSMRTEIEANFPGERMPEELIGFLNLINTSQFWSYQYKK